MTHNPYGENGRPRDWVDGVNDMAGSVGRGVGHTIDLGHRLVRSALIIAVCSGMFVGGLILAAAWSGGGTGAAFLYAAVASVVVSLGVGVGVGLLGETWTESMGPGVPQHPVFNRLQRYGVVFGLGYFLLTLLVWAAA